MNADNAFKLRCPNCKTRNRVPFDKAGQTAQCGRCKHSFGTDALLERQARMATDANFAEEVLASPLPVLVFCWATWCPGCREALPIVDQITADSAGRIRVVKLNIDNSPMTAAKYDIRSVPYFMVFDNGQMRDNWPGGMDRHATLMRMAPYI